MVQSKYCQEKIVQTKFHEDKAKIEVNIKLRNQIHLLWMFNERTVIKISFPFFNDRHDLAVQYNPFVDNSINLTRGLFPILAFHISFLNSHNPIIIEYLGNNPMWMPIRCIYQLESYYSVNAKFYYGCSRMLNPHNIIKLAQGNILNNLD